jgi:hypothetical protein
VTSDLSNTKGFDYTGCPLATEPGISLIIFTTNEDIATKFEVDLPHCVRNVKEKKVLLFKFRCNIFIGVRIIKEMPVSITSGTPCRYPSYNREFGMKSSR